jgi:hypothetical protein
MRGIDIAKGSFLFQENLDTFSKEVYCSTCLVLLAVDNHKERQMFPTELEHCENKGIVYLPEGAVISDENR